MPVDYRVVLFATTPDQPPPAHLLDAAGVVGKGDRRDADFAAVKLQVTDPRLPLLLETLREQGIRPRIRAERKFSKQELDLAPWLLLSLPYVGFAVLPEQEYDFYGACNTCGSWAVPRPPLAADLTKMGKKVLDHAADAGGFLVVAASLAVLLRQEVSGVVLHPVAARQGTDSRFRWLEAEERLPPIARSSVVKRMLCRACGRSGHFDPYSEATEIHYAAADQEDAPDFAVMHEQFGEWKYADKRIGGSRRYVVSHNARQVLIRGGVRRTAFTPITLV